MNLRRFEDNYDLSGLEFPLPIKGISEFEEKNDISVNILGVVGKETYILRRSKYNTIESFNLVNLLLIADRECRHYTVIKSLSRLVASSNSKHKCKQHFCMNYLQNFQYEESRDKHFEYCKDNETIRIEMPNGRLIHEVSPW